jgi:UDP-2,3-diacylglucosamine pyrophosphatase LpxH
MKWLHLSDIHYNPKMDGRSSEQLRENLLLYFNEENIKVDEIFITGDFRHAYFQKDEEISDVAKQAVDYIKKIANSVGITNMENIHIVPGNHDLTRNRKEYLEEILQNYDYSNGGFEKDKLSFLQGRFSFFRCVCRELYGMDSFYEDFCLKVHTYRSIGNYVILYMNTAITCGSDDERGNLVIGNLYLYQALKNIKEEHPNKQIIVLAHHAIEYLSKKEREMVEQLFNEYPISMYLCGDAHEVWCRQINQHLELTVGCMMQAKDVEAVFCIGDTEANKITANHWDAKFSQWSNYDGFNKYILRLIGAQNIQSLFREPNGKYELELTSREILPATLKNRDFDSVFDEVGQATIGLSNPEDLRIFRLKVEDNNFSYATLKKFLNTNIGRYVHSRAKMEQYHVKDDVESIGLEAAQYLREHKTGNELGEMLLYSFLEEVLHAPKLFTKAELGNITGNCDGIHIQTLPGAAPTYQMVFGTSDIQGNLTLAIDKAFDAVVKIKNEKPDSMMLVESAIFNCAFEDMETTEKVKNILLPSKKNQDMPSTAFGLFVGYTIDMDEDDYMLPLSDFKNKIEARLQADIIAQASYIYNKIKVLCLGCHSFYIYVIPFNDADKDKNEIINKLIGGDVS